MSLSRSPSPETQIPRRNNNESSTALSLSLNSILTVGSLVTFKANGLRGYIIDVDEDTQTCDVRYELDDNVEYDVEYDEIKLATIGSCASRSGLNRHATLPPSTSRTASSTNNVSTEGCTGNTRVNASVVALYEGLKEALKDSATVFNHHSISSLDNTNDNEFQHPLRKYLSDGKNKQKGWLRKVIKAIFWKSYSKKAQTNQNIQHGSDLTMREKALLNMMTSLFSGFSPYSGIAKGYGKLICHAFGIHPNTRLRIYKRAIDNDFTNMRKVRKDYGVSVFSDEKKRRQTFTGFHTFKRERNSEYRETTDRIPNHVLVQEWNDLSEEQCNAYDQLAERELCRARTLWDDLKELLLKTKGKIPYSLMVSQLGNIVSKTAIMNILKSQEGYYLRKDRILPALDGAAKKRRVKWAHTFWWFWKMAKFCPTEKIQYVLVHMDEKWFYAIKTRTNCKVLTSIGLEPKDYYCHHKSYLGKIMFIVVTAFVPVNNDITQGGRVIPVACIRAGREVIAQKNSYKRIYKEDGTYHYPALPENLQRKKGESYFKAMDITGSNEGSLKDPKCSLLKTYKMDIIPALEEKVVKVLSPNGEKHICIVKQEDSAGAHQDETYLFEMREEFTKRDWLLFNQPSQLPVTNVHDACIFPMLSKEVSREQAVSFGSRMLRQEQLLRTVMKVWNNGIHKQAMARAFVAHPQIVCAIIQHNGDNNYLSEKGGLSFGVRSTYKCNEEGDGVDMIQLAPQNEADTAAGTILEDQRRRGILKYETPTLDEMTEANPTSEMKEIVKQYFCEDMMTENDTDVRDALTELLLEEASENLNDG